MSDRPHGTAPWSYWFPAILVAILISVFSTQSFTAERTVRVILPILYWLLPWAPSRLLHLLHLAIRHTTHVTAFGILSILECPGVRAGSRGWYFNWRRTP